MAPDRLIVFGFELSHPPHVTLALDARAQGQQSFGVAGYVYILASKRNGTLYIGVTNDLVRRVYEHREALVPGFTKTHGVKALVHYEVFDDISAAIGREKVLKHWVRKWKLDLIERDNPQWRDLWDELNG